MTWDVTTPAGSENRILGDDRIRELKTDIQTSLRGDEAEGVEAVFPGGDTANPVYRYRGIKDTTANRPAAADYGLFFDTTRNALQRSNGSTWDDIATMIPSGTKTVFYQASAPVGWTAVALNDKFLRVVTAGGTGGSTGGTVAASTSLASHTHTVSSESSHTHDLGNHTHTTPAHTHQLDYTTTNYLTISSPAHLLRTLDSDGDNAAFKDPSGTGGNVNFRIRQSGTKSGEGGGTSGAPSSNTSGTGSAHDHGGATGNGSFAGAFAYADIIVATKD